MPATITDVVFDRNTLRASPICGISQGRAVFSDGREASAFILANPKNSSRGVDPFRYRIRNDWAAVKDAPDGNYVLLVGREGTNLSPAVSFNIYAKGEAATVRQTSFDLMAYVDDALADSPADAVENIKSPDRESEMMTEKKRQLACCVSFLKEKLSPVIDAGESFLSFLANSINHAFAPDMIEAELLRREKWTANPGPQQNDGPRPSV